MKRIIIVLVAFCLTILLSINLFADDSMDEGINLLATCTNHNFTDFVEYRPSSNKHKYECSNPGCTAYIVEACYNEAPCLAYPNQDYKSCSRCGIGKIYNIHNYVPKHVDASDSIYRHIKKCSNTSAYGPCSAVSGSYESCSLGTSMIWRGYVVGSGHYITRTCTGCNYRYIVGHYNPTSHISGTDPNCQYCTMSSSSVPFS